MGIDENMLENESVVVFPNPSNDVTTILYHLNKKENVRIELFDIIGKKVVELENKNQAEGDYSYNVSKQDYNLKSGIYFVKFSVEGNTITKKILTKYSTSILKLL